MSQDRQAAESARAELARERARADSFEMVNRAQAASLLELAALSAELRCQVADLADDALSSEPVPPQRLRNVTGRMNGLAQTLSRAAHGYTGARTTDMLYRTVDDDLRSHNWTPRPDQGLQGVLPPIPISEIGDGVRGFTRGWHRGPQWITLWFTSPTTIAYADSSDHGRLPDVDAVHAVITSSRSLSASALAEWAAACQQAHITPFDAPYSRVFEHLRAGPWFEIDVDRCDEYGVRTPGGLGNTSEWASPSDPDFRLYAWGIGDEPAHVRYWAGPVVDMAHLVQVTGEYR
ncbi:hypothetical protein LX86_003351 [Lentzea aerocolonigenes]|nr:hypothetical protein [Lentzea aerocolonigenes]